MACKNLKDKKEEIVSDPYIKDVRYMALKPDVRQIFKRYLALKKDGSLTDFLKKRKAIDEKNAIAERELLNEVSPNGEGKLIRETNTTGGITTRILKKGDID